MFTLPDSNMYSNIIQFHLFVLVVLVFNNSSEDWETFEFIFTFFLDNLKIQIQAK